MTEPGQAPRQPRNSDCVLAIKAGRLHARVGGAAEFVPATIVYLRPLSARSEIALFDDDSHEIVTLRSLDDLAPPCRAIAEEQLSERYHLPRITAVQSIETLFGTHYWKVQTDKGPCKFAFKEPGKNVTQLGEDHLVLRDTIGNQYEIPSIAALDLPSQRQVQKIL